MCDGDKFVSLYCAECGGLKRVIINCGDRTCPTCRKKEYKRLLRKYRPAMDILSHKCLVLVTLTMAIEKGEGVLRDKILKIKKSWQKLIRHELFKNAIQGGYYTIEIKWSEKSQGWNVHIHALCEIAKGARIKTWRAWNALKMRMEDKADVIPVEGEMLSIQQLKEEWEELTGDSHRVDIAPVTQAKGRKGGAVGALSYILKYMSKPAEISGKTIAYCEGLKGFKLLHAFGTWHPNSKFYRFADVIFDDKVPATCGVCKSVTWISEFELSRLLRDFVKSVEAGERKTKKIKEKLKIPLPDFVQSLCLLIN